MSNLQSTWPLRQVSTDALHHSLSDYPLTFLGGDPGVGGTVALLRIGTDRFDAVSEKKNARWAKWCSVGASCVLDQQTWPVRAFLIRHDGVRQVLWGELTRGLFGSLLDTLEEGPAGTDLYPETRMRHRHILASRCAGVLEKVQVIGSKKDAGAGPEGKSSKRNPATEGKLLQNAGWMEMAVTALRIRILDEARPQKWMAAMGCRPDADGKTGHLVARSLWPDYFLAERDGDGLMLAEYARRLYFSGAR